jgi:hypothetical protein
LFEHVDNRLRRGRARRLALLTGILMLQCAQLMHELLVKMGFHPLVGLCHVGALVLRVGGDRL